MAGCGSETAPASRGFTETQTAARAASWLKELQVVPSSAAPVHAMNPFHVGPSVLSDAERMQIHQLGMAGFYADPKLQSQILSKLKAAFEPRSKILKQANVYFTREIVGIGFWEMVEPTAGTFHFEISDVVMNAIQRAGSTPLVVVQPFALRDQVSAGHAPQSFCDPLFSGGDYFALQKNTGPGPAFDLAAYEKFLAELRKHTKQTYFEIGNEMEGPCGGYSSSAGALDYIALLESSRKGLGPDATIVNGGSIRSASDEQSVNSFWTTFFDNGGGDLIDVLNIHYNQEWSTAQGDFSKLDETLTFFGGLMAKNSVKKQIWITEACVGDPKVTEQQAAEWLLQRFSFAAARNTTRIFVQFSDDKWPVGPPPRGLGPLGISSMLYNEKDTQDFHAQLVFYAQKLINLKLNGFTACEELVYGEQYRFTVNGKPVYVLWGTSALPSALSGGKKVKVTDLYGNETTTTQPDINGRVVFIELEG